jgi:hypothetical protein
MEAVAVRVVSETTLVSLASMDSLRVSMEHALPKEGNEIVWTMWSAVIENLGLRLQMRLRTSRVSEMAWPMSRRESARDLTCWQ